MSDAKRRANAKFKAAAYDQIALYLPKGQKELIKAHAAQYQSEVGEKGTAGYSPQGSMTAFIFRAINEAIERDKGQSNTDDTGAAWYGGNGSSTQATPIDVAQRTEPELRQAERDTAEPELMPAVDTADERKRKRMEEARRMAADMDKQFIEYKARQEAGQHDNGSQMMINFLAKGRRDAERMDKLQADSR
jgi:hypothetical protein